MQIGWIDLSEKDKRMALEVIRLGKIQGTIDKLGIGVLRDDFAEFDQGIFVSLKLQ